MTSKLAMLALVGGLVVASDQGSKRLAVAALKHGCETIATDGPAPPRITRCDPHALEVDLGEASARALRFERGPTALYSLACEGDAACMGGRVRLGETPPGTRAARPERDALGEALLMLRGVPVEADHLTTGPDGQLHRVVAIGADGRRSTLRLRYRSPRRGVDVIPGFLRLRYVENPGAAWGLFGEVDERYRGPLFFGISALALAFLGRVYARTRREDGRARLALALIIGGAVGNVIDRLFAGSVVDFIELHLGDALRWPTFNVADVAISVGVLLLIVDGLVAFARARARRNEEASPPSSPSPQREEHP